MTYSHIKEPTPGVTQGYTIVVDSELMTWTSTPANYTVKEPETLRFGMGGPAVAGKEFTIFPDGHVE